MDKILFGERLTLKMLVPSSEISSVLWPVIQQNKSYLSAGGIYLMCSNADDVSSHISSGQKLFLNEGFDYYIFDKNKFVGSIWGEKFNSDDKEPVVMLSGWIAKEYAGKGYMQEVLSTLEEAYFSSNNTPLGGYVIEENQASKHMILKAGYVQELNEEGFVVLKTKAQWERLRGPRCIVPANNAVISRVRRDKFCNVR